jgi:hypothetical protein
METKTVLETFSDGKVLYRVNRNTKTEDHLQSNTDGETHSLNRSRHEARRNVEVRYHTKPNKQIKEIKDTVYYFED